MSDKSDEALGCYKCNIYVYSSCSGIMSSPPMSVTEAKVALRQGQFICGQLEIEDFQSAIFFWFVIQCEKLKKNCSLRGTSACHCWLVFCTLFNLKGCILELIWNASQFSAEREIKAIIWTKKETYISKNNFFIYLSVELYNILKLKYCSSNAT